MNFVKLYSLEYLDVYWTVQLAIYKLLLSGYLAILNKLYNNQFVPDDSLKRAVLYHSITFFIIQKTWHCFKW